jgi:hypothetical protein
MKSFIVYDETGRILRTGTCADSDLPLQGQHVIEGLANDDSQYVSNGAVVDMPYRPSLHHKFNYETKQWMPDPTAAQISVRAQRDQLLASSDWTQLPDVPLETKQAWAAYRQELRDIPAQSGYPFNIVWPTPPTA